MAGSSGAKKPRACLDAGMLVAMVLGTIDMHHDGAVRVCGVARRSGFQLITSRLAVMEMIKVVRSRAASSRMCRPGHAGDLDAAKAHVCKTVDQALDFVRKMERRGHLIVMEVEDRSLDFVLLHRKMLEHPGRTVSGKRSRTCRHRGVGPYDWMLFALAKSAGASVICTTDAALADIAGRDDEFGRIQVQLTSAPLIGLLSGSAARFV